LTRTSPDRSAAAIAALQAALAAEQAAIFGYGVVGAHLSGTRQRAAQSDWVAHQLAADQLAALIRAAGARPHASAVGYEIPFAVQSARQARSLAVILEDRVAQAYLALVALSDNLLRELGGHELRAAALRAASWRGTTVAFPGLPSSSLRA
jgi:hypothetical protein